jgi:chromosome segregation ATPase
MNSEQAKNYIVDLFMRIFGKSEAKRAEQQALAEKAKADAIALSMALADLKIQFETVSSQATGLSTQVEELTAALDAKNMELAAVKAEQANAASTALDDLTNELTEEFTALDESSSLLEEAVNAIVVSGENPNETADIAIAEIVASPEVPTVTVAAPEVGTGENTPPEVVSQAVEAVAESVLESLD